MVVEKMSEEFDRAELMAVVLSRYIKDGDIMFQGAATPLPMVAIELAKARGVDITYFSAFGINPNEPINFEKLLTRGFKYANQIKCTSSHASTANTCETTDLCVRCDNKACAVVPRC